jgi:hypothetical protein
MSLSPTSSRGGVAVPFSVASVPAGTTFEVDEFGYLTLTGVDGNTAGISLEDSTDPDRKVVLDSDAGLDIVSAAGAVVMHLGQAGFVLALHAAPADNVLAAGECGLWFDQTNGAAKLMLKARQADGTIKTGSVNVQT